MPLSPMTPRGCHPSLVGGTLRQRSWPWALHRQGGWAPSSRHEESTEAPLPLSQMMSRGCHPSLVRSRCRGVHPRRLMLRQRHHRHSTIHQRYHSSSLDGRKDGGLAPPPFGWKQAPLPVFLTRPRGYRPSPVGGLVGALSCLPKVDRAGPFRPPSMGARAEKSTPKDHSDPGGYLPPPAGAKRHRIRMQERSPPQSKCSSVVY